MNENSSLNVLLGLGLGGECIHRAIELGAYTRDNIDSCAPPRYLCHKWSTHCLQLNIDFIYGFHAMLVIALI